MANSHDKPCEKEQEPDNLPKPGFCRCGARLRSCPWGLQPHGFCPECETDHIKDHREEYQGGDGI